jgi:mannose-6-phosphate isomerase-like protein (cupin superfamily)
MPVIHSAQAEQFEMPNVTFKGLAAPSRGAKENCTWHFTLAPKSPGLLHQITREEIMIALSGTAVAEIGGERHVIGKGDAIIIPAHTDFKLSNESADAFEGIAVLPVGAQALIGSEAPFTPPWAV